MRPTSAAPPRSGRQRRVLWESSSSPLERGGRTGETLGFTLRTGPAGPIPEETRESGQKASPGASSVIEWAGVRRGRFLGTGPVSGRMDG